jgi:competence protein ComEC
VTHADLDHIGGVPFITDKYKVDDLIFNFDINLSGITREINNKLGEYEITPVTVSAGDRIYLDRTNNIYLDILWSHPEFKNENKNENSIISHLNYKDVSFMLTGDAGKEVENFLINIFDNKKIKSNVLKLGHHGSKTSTAELFVKSVAPQYAVVSAGEDNKFGHPHNEVMSTVGNTKTNIKILETKNGPVIFQTDGRNLWVNEI